MNVSDAVRVRVCKAVIYETAEVCHPDERRPRLSKMLFTNDIFLKTNIFTVQTQSFFLDTVDSSRSFEKLSLIVIFYEETVI